MAVNTVQTPAVRQAAAAQQTTLDALVALAATQAAAGLMDMARRMSAVLLDLTGAGLDPQAVGRRIRSGNLLKDNAYAFVHLATTGIELALRKEVALLAPAVMPTAPAPPTLSLVPLEEMDDRLAFAAISRPFDIQQSERLASLGVRLGMLLGRDLVRADRNPFRPEVFLRALQQAWCEFEPDEAAHALIVPLLRIGVVFDLGPTLDALNQKLKPARSGERDGRFARTDDSAATQAARARRDAAVTRQLRRLFDAAEPASCADLDIPVIPDLPQGAGSWRPSAAAGFAGSARPAAAANAPASGGAAPLIEVLERLAGAAAATRAKGALAGTPAGPYDVFYLPRLKQGLAQGTLSRGDATTLDLLSRVFETVLRDDSISQETRELIAFLQVPVLKAALKDRSFFFEDSHPARRMLDLLSSAGWERPAGEQDPVYRAMQRGVDTLRRDAPPEAFAAAVADLEASIAERERREAAAIAGPIARATRQEKRAAALGSARKAVSLRLAGEQVVALVGTFLEQRWTPVLALAYSIEDDKPGAVDNATRTMDELIWSVKPRATQEQRKQLIKRLPAILAALNKWLDAVKWQDAERLQFFAELAECHAAIVRAPIELSPERQLELAVEAAQQDALRRIEVEQLGAAEDETPLDPAMTALSTLERGMRVEFLGTDGVRKLRLAWVSPLRTLFIFTGAGRREAFSLPAERLLDAFRGGGIRVLAREGVVGRVLTEAVGEPAMNDPMPAAHAG